MSIHFSNPRESSRTACGRRMHGEAGTGNPRLPFGVLCAFTGQADKVTCGWCRATRVWAEELAGQSGGMKRLERFLRSEGPPSRREFGQAGIRTVAQFRQFMRFRTDPGPPLTELQKACVRRIRRLGWGPA